MQHIDDVVRFYDPPLPRGALAFRLLSESLVPLVFALSVLTIASFLPRPSGDVIIWMIAAIGAMMLIQSLTAWRYATINPTLIDITSEVVALTLASGKRIVIPRDELSGIHASTPRRMVGAKGRISSLIVQTRFRNVKLLPSRDYVEVRWLAHELRKVVGLPADDLSEPPLKEGIDSQRTFEAEAPPALELPDPKLTTALPPRRSTHSWGKRLLQEYDDFGCGATAFLFFAVIVGMLVISRLAGIAVICLQLGPDAFFQRGVDYLPHRSRLLNNGQQIQPIYDLVRALLSLAGLAAWVLVVLLITVGLNRLIKHRAKQARARLP